jgi:hypothetical protein
MGRRRERETGSITPIDQVGVRVSDRVRVRDRFRVGATVRSEGWGGRKGRGGEGEKEET